MPILRLTSIDVTPPPVITPPITPRTVQQPARLGYTYIDPDGHSWGLSDVDGWDMPGGLGVICSDIVGISGVPQSFSSVPLVQGGALPQQLIAQPRTIIMTLTAIATGGAAGQLDYLRLLDRISYAFTTVRNQRPAPGLLIVQRPDGSARQCTVYCTSGNDQPDDSSVTTSGLLYTFYTMTFTAPDPYFYDTEALPTFNFEAPDEDATGILPLLPVSLQGATNLGDVTITNGGNADAYGIWAVTGPGKPTVINNTTGRQWGFNTALDDAQTAIITTQPGQQSVKDEATGDSLWDRLVEASPRDLWPFVPGDNKITVTMDSSGDGTEVDLSLTQSWQRG